MMGVYQLIFSFNKFDNPSLRFSAWVKLHVYREYVIIGGLKVQIIQCSALFICPLQTFGVRLARKLKISQHSWKSYLMDVYYQYLSHGNSENMQKFQCSTGITHCMVRTQLASCPKSWTSALSQLKISWLQIAGWGDVFRSVLCYRCLFVSGIGVLVAFSYALMAWFTWDLAILTRRICLMLGIFADD